VLGFLLTVLLEFGQLFIESNQIFLLDKFLLVQPFDFGLVELRLGLIMGQFLLLFL
jgi:hypothetical protein